MVALLKNDSLPPLRKTGAMRRGLKAHALAIYDPMETTFAERKRHYWEDEGGIVAFVQDILGATPHDYQERILLAVQKHRRVAVKSLRGVGKTTTASWVLLWLITCAPGETKCITTASVWEQLKSYLWAEIRKWALKGDWEHLGIQMRDGRELLDMGIKLDRGQRTAFATSPGKPERIEGAHAETLLYVLDEAKIIPDAIFDAIEGAFSTKGTNAFVLTISTPGAPLGRFYDIHRKKTGLTNWYPISVTYEDALAAGTIDLEHAESMKNLWGEESPLYKNHFLGEFADSSDFGIIRLSWLEAANKRWHEFQAADILSSLDPKEIREITTYGIDPADTGMDMTAIARFVGRYCDLLEYHNKEVMETIPLIEKHTKPDERIPIGFDGIGVGAGAYQTLRNMRYKIKNLKASARAVDRVGQPLRDSTGTMKFLNMRIGMYWALREALDPNAPAYAELALPPDDRLLQDLIIPEYTDNLGVYRFAEDKKKLREKLGNRSPDGGDAVAMAWWMQSMKTRSRGARVIQM